MRMGIGIGWPNSTSGRGGSLLIESCIGRQTIVYSTSSVFEPGIYVYTDPEMTIPFASGGPENTSELIGQIGGYSVNNLGLVIGPLLTCPT